MSRPTSDHKSRVIKVRVNNEIADRLAEKGNISEAVREYILMGIEKHGEIQKEPLSDGYVPQKRNGIFNEVSEDVLKDLCQMARLSGTDLEGLMKSLQGGMDDGSLVYEGGRIKGQADNRGYDLSDFIDACEAKGKNPQEILNRFTRMVWNT